MYICSVYSSMSMIPIEVGGATGWTLHNGKASHDALSIGNLKLPQEDVCQRQCGV